METKGYLLLIVEAIARTILTLGMYSLAVQYQVVGSDGMIPHMTFIGMLSCVIHILFEKLGEILRGIETVDGEERRTRR